MSRRILTRVVAVISGVLTVSALVIGMTGVEEPERGTVVATLADAGSLEPGNEVRAAGVLVGSIEDIALIDGRAQLTLDVDPGVLPLHQDASINVRPVNLLGENYIDLDRGSPSAPLMDDPIIPESQTHHAVTLQDVFNTFRDPNAAALATVVTALGEGMHGSGGHAAAAIKALKPAMTKTGALGALLANQKDVIDQLVARLEPVSRALAANEGRTLDRLVSSTERTLSTVAADHRALDQTLAQLPGTIRSARRTMAELTGAADAATPTLKALRPLTGNLTEITGELDRFADAADPALASLGPVLDHAHRLLDEAAPAVEQLRRAGPELRGVASSARPLGRELLDEHLGDLMAFVRKWSLSTNGEDAISHYFRGVVFVTPGAINDLANSALPVQQTRQDPAAVLPKPPKLPSLPLLSGTDGQSTRDPANATGLTREQEQSMMGQLLGGL